MIFFDAENDQMVCAWVNADWRDKLGVFACHIVHKNKILPIRQGLVICLVTRSA
ncbi:hypothetical protein [Marivita sp.]|jgi:hypothetical protein|uniref:hypothetical protein n=1 Tax=Marivita sp. TaxID=2003365 RepID=UPI003F718FCE